MSNEKLAVLLGHFSAMFFQLNFNLQPSGYGCMVESASYFMGGLMEAARAELRAFLSSDPKTLVKCR